MLIKDTNIDVEISIFLEIYPSMLRWRMLSIDFTEFLLKDFLKLRQNVHHLGLLRWFCIAINRLSNINIKKKIAIANKLLIKKHVLFHSGWFKKLHFIEYLCLPALGVYLGYIIHYFHQKWNGIASMLLCTTLWR